MWKNQFARGSNSKERWAYAGNEILLGGERGFIIDQRG